MSIHASELILDDKGRIYHLAAQPGDLSQLIITVGDPDRIQRITRHFDQVFLQRSNREFSFATGRLGAVELSVVSTGIGTDNIDIALTEIDALFNVDFASRSPKESHSPLSFIRLGTSGTFQKDIPTGSVISSSFAVGFDALLHFYADSKRIRDIALEEKVEIASAQKNYAVQGNADLLSLFQTISNPGITITCPGFYGPQARKIRLAPYSNSFFQDLQKVKHKGYYPTNFEMETAGIYGMAALLGHRAMSLNAILANRIQGTFAQSPEKVIDQLIEKALETIESAFS